jgi:hypothetical protein
MHRKVSILAIRIPRYAACLRPDVCRNGSSCYSCSVLNKRRKLSITSKSSTTKQCGDLEDNSILCSLTQRPKRHTRIAKTNVAPDIACGEQMLHARMKKGARELGCLLQGCLSTSHTGFSSSIMKDDAAIFAGAYSKRNSKRENSLRPPCAHEDFVLIRMTGHAPDKALRAPSAPGIRRLHDTNGVLGVRLGWTVTFQPVRGIAC